MTKWWLISDEDVQTVRAALNDTEEWCSKASLSDFRRALHHLDSGLHTTERVPADAKITKLELLLARAYPFLTWRDDVRGVDPSLDAEFDSIVTEVELAIQHLPDDKEM